MKISRMLAITGFAAMALSSAFATLYTQGVTLNGSTSFAGWDGNGFAANGVNYPGTGTWPGAVLPNAAGSDDSGLFKVANGVGGGPYPYYSSAAQARAIYHGGQSSTPNTLGGTLKVSDATPVSGLQTIVFQVIIQEAFGYDFYSDVAPVLKINGAATTYAANFTHLISQEQNGTFTPPGGQPEPLYNNLYGFQWDVSGLGSINSFDLEWSSVQHALIFGLRLDESNQVHGDYFATVPEPGTMAALGLGAVALLRRRKKQA